MKTRIFSTFIFVLALGGGALGQVSWLDRPLSNWNTGGGVVPTAPRSAAPIEAMCRTQIRTPDSLADRAVTRAGWSLFGPSYTYGATTVVTAMASVDGMCRPSQYNGFVFVNNRFVGTLAPQPTDARTDGALGQVYVANAGELSAEFARYRANDPLCCPSQTSTVRYTLGGAAGSLRPEDVDTNAACREGGVVETQDNVVSGTVTYRGRAALPAGSVLVVKVADVSRADASATVVAEQRIETAGRQVPISFDLAYPRDRIQERNRYAVQAEIRDSGGRLLYITDTSYPVITQGNPRNVEITVVPVGGGGGTGPRQNTLRGTVTYRQRIALTGNSEVVVRLIDSGAPDGTPVAEARVPIGNRQVPIPFELEYQNRDINRQRNYELQAEIRTDGRVRFRTEAGRPVTLRGQQAEDNVELVVVPASEGPETVTGRTFNLSKFGTGSMQIAGRNVFLIRGSVTVDANGDASVSLSSISQTIAFTGKLVFADDTTLRIAVQNSGNADASGEIQVTYAGRSLRNITATNLVLDGQNVALRF